ncbi:uncharacterized protein [Aquarana catesbeiana]|uniref:uncharacterized protein n=1 Tax=Aquarana catesbeiana TaxID=8400 RepID=UPI003CC9D6E6
MNLVQNMFFCAILILSLLSIAASRPQVLCKKSSLAVLGGDVTLSCEFQADLDVLQITWQKKKGKNTENMATYSEMYGSNIAVPFQERVSILSASSRNFSIKLSKLEKEDEAFYVCLFISHPDGAFEGEVSLNNISPPLEEHPNKVACVEEELDMEGANKGDQKIHQTQQHCSWVRYPIVLAAVILVIVTLIVFYYKAWRKTEPVTPKKLNKAETGQATPILSKNRSDEVNNGSTKVVNSPLNSPMNDSGIETPSSSEVTPSSVLSSSDRSIHKESPNSLLNQRKRQIPGTPTNVKRLDFE